MSTLTIVFLSILGWEIIKSFIAFVKRKIAIKIAKRVTTKMMDELINESNKNGFHKITPEELINIKNQLKNLKP
jgi:hypothetical protein